MSRSRALFSAAAVVALVGASVAVGSIAANAAPDAPVITNPGGTTADNTPILIQGFADNTLSLDQTVQVTVEVNGVAEVYCTATIAYFDPAAAPWSCTGATPLDYGDNTFYANQWEGLVPPADPDDISNRSNEVTYSVGGSDATIITSPASGTVTQNTNPDFTGTGPALGTVTVQLQGGVQELCSAPVDASGAWACQNTFPLTASDGTPGDTEETYSIEAIGHQLDTTVQPASAPIALTVQIPQTPVIDYYYAGTPPWQTGNPEPGMQGSMGLHTVNTTVWISTDGGIGWSHYCNIPTSDGSATVWYCTDPEQELVLGTNLLAATTLNAAGNPSALSAPITVERVDVPVITNMPNGTVTNDATPTIAGSAPWGSTFQVYKDSGPSPATFLCTAPAASGSFSCDSVPLVDGAYTVHVYSNQGIDVSSAPVSFTVDTVAPAAPVVVTSGSTNDTMPVISGTGEPGTVIILYRDGSPVVCSNAPVVVDGAGNWTCQTVTSLTPGGTYTWAATAEDAAGNTSGTSPDAELTIVVPPAPPVPPASAPALPQPTPTPTPSPTVPAALQPQPWTFEFGMGGTEFERGDSTELTGEGLPPGAIVEAEFHSTPVFLGDTSVSDAGTFALPVTIPDDATEGAHNFVVTITPAEGLPSTRTQPVTIIVHPKALGGPGESALPFVGQVSAEGAERNDPAAPSAFTTSLETMQTVFSNPAVVGGAALAGLALLLLVAFPAELLNSTISENYERMTRGMPRSRTPWWQRLTAWLQRTPIVGAVAMILVAAFVFGFVDPNFGFDVTSLRMFLACAIALFVLTYVSSVVSGAIIRRAWGFATQLELKPLGLILTVVGVVLSRILEFTPGVLLGLFLGLGIVGATTAAQRAKATLVQVGVIFGFAILGWAVYSILSAVVAPDTFVTALAFDTLVVVTAEGLTALFVGLLPIKMFIGPALSDHSKVLWALVYAVVAGAFVLIVLPSSWGELTGPLGTWLVVLVAFAAIALAVYLFFRFTGKDDDEDEPAEAEKDRVEA